jgi:hypothetical protein
MEEWLTKSQGKALALFGILPDTFWNMEVSELNAALEQHEAKDREYLEQRRLTNYIIAKPNFDPKKATPSMTQFQPFPWDKDRVKSHTFEGYDAQIEFAMRRGVTDWIPNYWYAQSETYKHLAKDVTATSNDGGIGSANQAAEIHA